MNIKTALIKPPIPTRSYDWQAYVDEQDLCADPDCSCRKHKKVGWGESEAEAIFNLMEQLGITDVQ